MRRRRIAGAERALENIQSPSNQEIRVAVEEAIREGQRLELAYAELVSP